MDMKRRQLLAGMVATGAALLAAAPVSAVPARRRGKRDPEPLQHFPGFAEGFYWYGGQALYIDEREMAWAPPSLDRSRLEPIPLSAELLPLVVSRLRKRRWSWTVEHAALLRVGSDRTLAEALLTTAIDEHGTRPATVAAARRLRHLVAALNARRTLIWNAPHTDGRAFPTRIEAA
jgi:hypothetical protein